jgi:hypothetical protein
MDDIKEKDNIKPKNKEKNFKASLPETPITTRENSLSDFSHRNNKVPVIKEPSDLITEPTGAQKERLIYMVDDALDVVDTALHTGPLDTRLKAAENVLDRTGLSRSTKTINTNTNNNLPSDVLVGLVSGLAKVFGAKDVTPSKLKLSKPSTEKDSFTLIPGMEPDTVPEASKKHSSVPASLLAKHGDMV